MSIATTTPLHTVQLRAVDDHFPPLLEHGLADDDTEALLQRLHTAVIAIEDQLRLLSARLRDQPSSASSAERLVVNRTSREIRLDGRLLDLTLLEHELLAHFAAHPHQALSRDSLLRAVWRYDYAGSTRTVDVHVARLRKKLGAAEGHLESVRGFGYRWRPLS